MVITNWSFRKKNKQLYSSENCQVNFPSKNISQLFLVSHLNSIKRVNVIKNKIMFFVTFEVISAIFAKRETQQFFWLQCSVMEKLLTPSYVVSKHSSRQKKLVTQYKHFSVFTLSGLNFNVQAYIIIINFQNH